MFGIDNSLIPQVAKMPANHTWAVFYMRGNLKLVEKSLSKWIELLADNLNVSYILENVLFLYMAHEAIIEFKQREGIQGNLFDDILPVIDNPYDAVEYALHTSWRNVTINERQDAALLMEKMFKGQILPFGAVQIPLPDGYRLMDPDRNPFFPVGMRPLFWANCEINDFEQYVPSRFYGIVDLETGHTFATATSKYCLYTNKQVYDLLREVAYSVFDKNEPKSNTIDHFELSKKSGVCKMTVMREEEEYQPLINDGWQALLEGINSYDKSEPLRYTFGYQNKRHRIPLLMPEYTVSIQTQHTIPFEEFRRKVLDEVQNNIQFAAIQKSFIDIIKALKNTKLADRDMLPLYCKYFGVISIPESENAQERLVSDLRYVARLIKESVDKYGKNAYAMLHVIMDYLSTRGRYTYNNDWELGKWVHDFLEASKSAGFSISGYIGNPFYDIVSWFEVQ